MMAKATAFQKYAALIFCGELATCQTLRESVSSRLTSLFPSSTALTLHSPVSPPTPPTLRGSFLLVTFSPSQQKLSPHRKTVFWLRSTAGQDSRDPGDKKKKILTTEFAHCRPTKPPHQVLTVMAYLPSCWIRFLPVSN